MVSEGGKCGVASLSASFLLRFYSYRNESECEARFGGHYMACSVADMSCCSGLTFADSLAVFVMRASECLSTSFICLISVSRCPRVPE